ncbi:hypothetical protein Ssi02_08440 [Sinosporangium siamense]|uniref:Uncharacterized protein n=1 Tax=Sinosporangium siamense TaxID=1367973 RepID=A0A919RB26_9ACTN|nr:hypothetical protein Ssi02_08440 [Sinosporangium siamense]
MVCRDDTALPGQVTALNGVAEGHAFDVAPQGGEVVEVFRREWHYPETLSRSNILTLSQISTFWINAANGAIILGALLIQRATGETSKEP